MTDVTVQWPVRTIFVHMPQILQCLRRAISLLVVNIPLSKLASFIYFKAHFPVVSMNFCILGYFKSWQNRVRVDDCVLMDSGTIFVYIGAVWNMEVLMAILCLAKMKEKIYMFSENIFIINAIDQGILATSKTKLWTMSLFELLLWFAVVMRTTEETHVCNFANLG